MKRLLLLLCLSAAVRPAAAQTAVSGFVRSLPERLARPLDDTLVVLRDLELLAPRRVMQSFDVVSDSTIYISQLGAFENHVPGRTRSHEVYVFEVRPGIIQTDMTAGVADKYRRMIEQEGVTPIRRFGQPEDVADQVLAACSGLLDFGTGTVLNADGGFHLRRL